MHKLSFLKVIKPQHNLKRLHSVKYYISLHQNSIFNQNHHLISTRVNFVLKK